MSDPSKVRKGRFGAFTAMERQLKAARALAERADETGATTAEPIAVTVNEPASVPWPRPYSLHAEAERDRSAGADALTLRGPQ